MKEKDAYEDLLPRIVNLGEEIQLLQKTKSELSRFAKKNKNSIQHLYLHNTLQLVRTCCGISLFFVLLIFARLNITRALYSLDYNRSSVLYKFHLNHDSYSL